MMKITMHHPGNHCRSALQARFYLMRAFAPAGEILFFAPPICRSALQALGLLDAGFRARTARYFLLLVQEKVPKEKDTRSTHRLKPVPCVPRQSGGRAQLVYLATLDSLKQGARLFPGLAAVLGECYGRVDLNPP